MGTACRIVFKDDDNRKVFLERGSDGCISTVLPDLEDLVKGVKKSWGGSEMGLLVASFLTRYNDPMERIPNYSISLGPRSDISYIFVIAYEGGEWVISIGDVRCLTEMQDMDTKAKEKIFCPSCYSLASVVSDYFYRCDNKTCEEDKPLILSTDGYDSMINGKYRVIAFNLNPPNYEQTK